MFAEVSHGWDLNRKRRPLYHWPCHSALYSRRQLWHLPCHFEDRVSVVGSGFRKSEFFNISGHRSWKFDQLNFALVDLFVEDHVTALCKGVPVKYFRLNICDLFSVFSSSKLVCSSSIGNNHWHAIVTCALSGMCIEKKQTNRGSFKHCRIIDESLYPRGFFSSCNN